MAYNEFDYDTTKHTLGAVNSMLNMIGEADIAIESDIDDVLEAVTARKLLMETKRELLSSGWEVNTDENYILPIDPDGYITVPINILKLSSSDNDLTQRGALLYSKSRMSTIFEEAQTVSIAWDISFNTIPQSLRNYIVARASKNFVMKTIGSDTEQYGMAAEAEVDALLEARRAEIESMDNNMLSNMDTTGLGL